MIRIEAKNKNYNGVIANITFENGVATVENLSDGLRYWFIKLGAKIEEIKEEEIKEEEIKEEKKTKAKPEKGEYLWIL